MPGPFDPSENPWNQAKYALVATQETTTSASYTDLTTPGPAVTINVSANGLAYVTFSCEMFNSVAADYTDAGFAISGATTRAAGTPYRTFTQMINGSQPDIKATYSVLLTGLTPGLTTFTMKYRIIVGGTGTFGEREISVIGF